jgi:hypothetical protein
VSPNTGPLASAAWLATLEVVPPGPRWFVEIVLGADDAGPRFHLDVYSEEWGFRFVHGELASWIRVTDIPFVHGRDDHGLLPETPKLRAIGRLLGMLEGKYGMKFPRDPVVVRTNVPEAEAKVREWLATL